MDKSHIKAPHVLVLPSFLECRWGEGGTFFIEQAAIMQQIAGWQVGMMMPYAHHITRIKKRNLPTKQDLEITEREGVKIYAGYYPYYLPYTKMRAKKLFAEKLFKAYAAKHGKPDYLWVQAISLAGYLARHLSQKHSIPYFVHEHSATYAAKRLKALTRKGIKAVIQDAVYCAAVSDGLKKDMLAQLAVEEDKIRVVHNPVGMVFANATPAPRRQNPFVFVSTAYLRPEKNIDKIIRAFAKVQADSPNTRLLLVGDGVQRGDLEKLVGNLLLTDVVTFTGMQSREQTCEHLQTADAFVAASNYETFGLALVESLMCSLPSISAAVGIAGEAINADNGVLLDKTTEQDIAAAMRQVMQGGYDSQRIQQAARERFSPDKFAQEVQAGLEQGK